MNEFVFYGGGLQAGKSETLRRSRESHEALARCAASSGHDFDDWVKLLQRKTCDAIQIERACQLGMSFDEIEAGSGSLDFEIQVAQVKRVIEEVAEATQGKFVANRFIAPAPKPEPEKSMHPELKRIERRRRRERI